MAQRGHYRTRQQESVLKCLRENSEGFLTAESLFQKLRESGVSIGQTTVYRALDRLVESGDAVRIIPPDNTCARYRYLSDVSAYNSEGQMVCLKCGKSFPLKCTQLDLLAHHIENDHCFRIDTHQTILYGYCSTCKH